MELKFPEEDEKSWHKIYFGLEVLLHFKKTFPSEELLPAKETEIIESVCKILRAIYHAVEVFSGPICPTANMYFNELWIVRTTLEEQASTDHTELSRMVWEMQEALDEFWQNSYVWLSVPVVFDPRFKFAFIEFHLKLAFGSEAAKYVSAVHDTIWELFVIYIVVLYISQVSTHQFVKLVMFKWVDFTVTHWKIRTSILMCRARYRQSLTSTLMMTLFRGTMISIL